MLKYLVNAIKIIEDMCSNPYNNSRDRRMMKRGLNYVDKDDSQIKFGKQMQTLTLKIERYVNKEA